MQPFSSIFGTGAKAGEKAANQSFSPDEIVQIPVDDIHPNRFQPRSIFNEKAIEELAQTIRTHGMIQPIIVRKLEENDYEIIAGERRWRAVKFLEWETLSAIIRDMTITETACVALIENLDAEQRTVSEDAHAYAKFMKMHPLTNEALAQILGKNQAAIANKLLLFKLPEPVQKAILHKSITERHARA